jgi:protein-S-isoprenylcysteine O-methyltransferase Ste14
MKLRPPLLVLISLALMLVLGYFAPGATVISSPYNLVGIVLAALGAVAAAASARRFARAGTTIKILNEPSVLVTDGLFRWSRNPIYAGFVLFLAGAAILLGAATPFLVVIAFGAIADRWYIAFEERALMRRFGDDYAAYKRRTRRWI